MSSFRKALEEIRTHAKLVRSVIATTFTFEPAWFETSIFRPYLRQVPAGVPIALLCQKANGVFTPDVRLYGRVDVFPVQPEGGLFHPKLLFADFGKHVLFGLGSANLTPTSYGRSVLEFQSYRRYEGQDAEYVRSLVGSLGRLLIDQSWIWDTQRARFQESFSSVMASSARGTLSSTSPTLPRLSHRLLPEMRPLWKELQSRVEAMDGFSISRAYVLSPFYSNRAESSPDESVDTGGLDLLDKIALGKGTPVEILCRPDGAPWSDPARPVEYRGFSRTRERSYTGFHAKATVLELARGEERRYLTCWGSSNFTRPAWEGDNIEADQIVLAERNPLERLLKDHFQGKLPRPKREDSKKPDSTEDEDLPLIQTAILDCTGGLVRFSIQGKMSKGDCVAVDSADGKLRQVFQAQATGRLQRVMLKRPFLFERWSLRTRGPRLLLLRGDRVLDTFNLLLTHVPAQFVTEEGWIQPSGTPDDCLAILELGTMPKPKHTDPGGEGEDEVEVSLFRSHRFEQGNADDHRATADRVAASLRPWLRRVSEALRDKDAERFKTECANLKFAIPRFTVSATSGEGHPIYRVLLTSLKLLLEGLHRQKRSRLKELQGIDPDAFAKLASLIDVLPRRGRKGADYRVA